MADLQFDEFTAFAASEINPSSQYNIEFTESTDSVLHAESVGNTFPRHAKRESSGGRQMQRARRNPKKREQEPIVGYLTVPEFAARFRIGRSTVYDAISSGRLKAIRIMTAQRIPLDEAERVEREGL